MELKVWVEGIQRIVCGVTETTTCQDVVFALAHATGKSGRFTLIERWRNNERQLAPTENPMKILLKWGEYSNDVQFILQRNESSKTVQKLKSANSSISGNSTGNSSIESPEKNRDVQKSHTFSGCHVTNTENIGVVKGIQQVKSVPLEVRESHSASPRGSPKKTGSYCSSDLSDSSRSGPPLKSPLAPPPYRDPPPPSSAVHHPDKFRKNVLQESTKAQSGWDDNNRNKSNDNSLHNAQYRELIALINYQREKLSNQQADLTKYDAEIVFWESKDREKQMQLEFIAQELLAVANTHKANQEQIQALSYVEEENEIVKQQEKTLKSEITLLRSKLANCETELLQCKNKIRLLMDELQLEQKAQNRRCESKKQIEKSLLMEMERLQKDIELAKQSTELHHLTAETLKKEVAALEIAIVEKKRQVEQLVQEMKEANLQSLTAGPEEPRAAGPAPPRAVPPRRMVGSPRQLENAAPTSKNPHGVWV